MHASADGVAGDRVARAAGQREAPQNGGRTLAADAPDDAVVEARRVDGRRARPGGAAQGDGLSGEVDRVEIRSWRDDDLVTAGRRVDRLLYGRKGGGDVAARNHVTGTSQPDSVGRSAISEIRPFRTAIRLRPPEGGLAVAFASTIVPCVPPDTAICRCREAASCKSG